MFSSYDYKTITVMLSSISSACLYLVGRLASFVYSLGRILKIILELSLSQISVTFISKLTKMWCFGKVDKAKGLLDKPLVSVLASLSY